MYGYHPNIGSVCRYGCWYAVCVAVAARAAARATAAGRHRPPVLRFGPTRCRCSPGRPCRCQSNWHRPCHPRCNHGPCSPNRLATTRRQPLSAFRVGRGRSGDRPAAPLCNGPVVGCPVSFCCAAVSSCRVPSVALSPTVPHGHSRIPVGTVARLPHPFGCRASIAVAVPVHSARSCLPPLSPRPVARTQHFPRIHQPFPSLHPLP
mmetsp:Transcript_645/g.2015  ORF Transcript_645/g.2015 Transcript_645/m.2015 type:complete len:206 (-) Transcript_645:1006-1623(-)